MLNFFDKIYARIFGNKITSVVGVVFFGLSFYFFVEGNITAGSAISGIGLTLLGMKDSMLGIKEQNENPNNQKPQ